MIVTKLLSTLSTPRSIDVDYESLVPRFEGGNGISRNLFQICLRGRGESSKEVLADLPDYLLSCMSSVRDVNSLWSYRLLCDKDAESFILDEYGPAVLSYYKRINPVYGSSRADFLKSLLLYRYGGAYIDLKSSMSHSLDLSIREDDNYLVFFWDNLPGGKHHCAIPSYIKEGEVLMGFIVGAQGNEFSRAVIIETMKRIDTYNPYIDGVGFGGVMKVAGPGMFTEVIYGLMQKGTYNYRIGKPFSEFGFILSFSPDYVPGSYQKQSKMTDYRKLAVPFVTNTSRFLSFINRNYLRIIAR